MFIAESKKYNLISFLFTFIQKNMRKRHFLSFDPLHSLQTVFTIFLKCDHFFSLIFFFFSCVIYFLLRNKQTLANGCMQSLKSTKTIEFRSLNNLPISV